MKNSPTWLVVRYVRDGDGWRTEVDNGPSTTPVIGAPTESYEAVRRMANRQGFLLRIDQRVWDSMVDVGRAPTTVPSDVSFFIEGPATDQQRLYFALISAAARFDGAGQSVAAEQARATARYAWHVSDDLASGCMDALEAGTKLLAEPFGTEGRAPKEVIEKLLAEPRSPHPPRGTAQDID